MIIRQGDVLLEKIADVEETIEYHNRVVRTRNNQIVIAEGEVTGHAHVVPAKGVAGIRINGQPGLRVTHGCCITHEEHDPIRIRPGFYRIVMQREYTPAGTPIVSD